MLMSYYPMAYLNKYNNAYGTKKCAEIFGQFKINSYLCTYNIERDMTDERMIINALAKEIAKRDLASLANFVSGMTFEQAFNVLNGFNLSSDPMMIGDKLLGFNTFFDLTYKSISTTIFKTEDGGCEVYDTADVWLLGVVSPIDTVTV